MSYRGTQVWKSLCECMRSACASVRECVDREAVDGLTRWIAGAVFAVIPILLGAAVSGQDVSADWFQTRDLYLVASGVAWQSLAEVAFVDSNDTALAMLFARTLLLTNIVLTLFTTAAFAVTKPGAEHAWIAGALLGTALVTSLAAATFIITKKRRTQ